jgi:hypothetical protein
MKNGPSFRGGPFIRSLASDFVIAGATYRVSKIIETLIALCLLGICVYLVDIVSFGNICYVTHSSKIVKI